jgi:preprotein translocase subunit SecG
MGSSFGGGSAGSLFGATGAANFFSRATKWVSVLFFACTLGLAYIGNNPGSRSAGPAAGGGVMQGYEAPAPAPNTPAPAAQPQADLPAAPGPAETPAVPSPSETPAAPAAQSAPPAENTTPAASESQQDTNTETKQ